MCNTKGIVKRSQATLCRRGFQDATGTGCIDGMELGWVMKSVKPNLSDAEMQELFASDLERAILMNEDKKTRGAQVDISGQNATSQPFTR